MSFELYAKTRAISEEETVSITASGAFALSPKIVEKYVKNYDHAQIYFDASTNRIGIKFCKKTDKFSYPLIHPKNSRRRIFSGRGFLKLHRINVDDKGKFKLQTYEVEKVEDGMVIIKVG